MMTLSQVHDYFLGYDAATFNVFSCSGNEPSESDLAAFESEIGRKLPDEFREFTMSPLGGLYMEVKTELWPPAKPFEGGPFWSFLRAIKVFGIAKGIPSWLDLREQYRRLADHGYPALLPFLQIAGDANLYCFTPSETIVLWDHEDPYEPQSVNETFPSLLLREIRELENRKNQKLRGEDKTNEYIKPRTPKQTR